VAYPLSPLDVNFSIASGSVAGGGAIFMEVNDEPYVGALPGKFKKGTKIKLIATPTNDSYIVKEWIVDGNPVPDSFGLESYIIEELEEVVTATVKFVEKRNISFSVEVGIRGSLSISIENGASLVEGSLAKIEKDSRVVLTATPNEGFEIHMWNINNNSVNNGKQETFIIESLEQHYTIIVSFVQTGLVDIEDAETPVISVQPQDVGSGEGAEITLSVEVEEITDGGTLSYQWYSATTLTNSGGTPVGNATEATFSTVIDVAGIYYYYVVVTNTNIEASGAITATAVSDPVTVTVEEVTVTSVTVTPNTVTVEVGNTHQFTATVNGTGYPAQSVTWTVSGNLNVGTTISSDGLLTVAAAETAKSFMVRATSTLNNIRFGTASVTVTGATGVEMPNITSPLKAWFRNDLLHITGLIAGETFSIYSVSGALIYRSVATGDEAVLSVKAQGVYIVQSGIRTVRVVNN